MRKVILLIGTNTYFSCLIEIGRILKQSGKYQPVFLFKNYPTSSYDIEICVSENIIAIRDDALYQLSPGKFSVEKFITEAFSNALQFLPNSVSRTIETLPYYFKRLVKKSPLLFQVIVGLVLKKVKIRSIKNMIKQQDIELIILAGDLVSYDTSDYIKAGHDAGIASVIVPGWMAGALESVQAVYNNPEHWLNNVSNKLVARIYPHWVYQHNERALLRLDAATVVVKEILGTAPPQPWILHSGHSDVIAVESDEMRQYCIREGLPLEKLVCTGSIAHDKMAHKMQSSIQNREILYSDLRMPQNKPMILTALPPNMMYGYWQPDCQFKTYEELVRFWVESLSSLSDYNIVVSLHPSVIYDDMKYIEQYGIKIAQNKIVDLIPLCDFFVAAVSSTIQWAIACGKPVVNYDVYKYRYTDYLKVSGVLTFEEKEKFLEYIHKLAYDKSFFEAYSEKQKSCMSSWGNLDGRAEERLLDLFTAMTDDKYSIPQKIEAKAIRRQI